MPVPFDTHQVITRLIQGELYPTAARHQTDLATLKADVQKEFKHLTWMIGVQKGSRTSTGAYAGQAAACSNPDAGWPARQEDPRFEHHWSPEAHTP